MVALSDVLEPLEVAAAKERKRQKPGKSLVDVAIRNFQPKRLQV
jgi:hypothetical protein